MARPGISRLRTELRHVYVPERGFTDVDQDVWLTLQASADFRRLHAGGIVDVAYRPFEKIRLKGTCYVGHAICGDVLLVFCEKVEGALSALLAFASHNAFKVKKAQSASSELSELIVLLVEQFLDAATTYASSGRKFQYTKIKSSGSLAGGKIDITKTIQLRSRGLGHLLAFEKNVVDYKTPINRVLLAALLEVENISSLLELPKSLISTSRSLSMFFSDCQDHEILYRERSFLADEALRLAESQSDDLIMDIMSLASVMLTHESFDSSSGQPPGLPRTWFLNLENMFETAVRNILIKICTDASISRGEVAPKPIFDDQQRQYRANPDIVVLPSSGDTAIGDVKYKIFEGSASATDVYQLLAHAEAFGAKKSFLIFPGDSYFARDLGRTRGKIQTVFFSVRLPNLESDLKDVARHLEFIRDSP